MSQVIQFATRAEVVCPFTQEQQYVVESIKAMKFLNGGTNMKNAFKMLLDTMKYAVITDGEPMEDPSNEIKSFLRMVRCSAIAYNIGS